MERALLRVNEIGIFIKPDLFHLKNDWAVINLTEIVVEKYFKEIALGGVKRYLMDNINAINYILNDSLDGGGSESLLNDAQGKTHAQLLLSQKIEIPDNLIEV